VLQPRRQMRPPGSRAKSVEFHEPSSALLHRPRPAPDHEQKQAALSYSTKPGPRHATMASMAIVWRRRACSLHLPSWSLRTAKTRWRNSSRVRPARQCRRHRALGPREAYFSERQCGHARAMHCFASDPNNFRRCGAGGRPRRISPPRSPYVEDQSASAANRLACAGQSPSTPSWRASVPGFVEITPSRCLLLFRGRQRSCDGEVRWMAHETHGLCTRTQGGAHLTAEV